MQPVDLKQSPAKIEDLGAKLEGAGTVDAGNVAMFSQTEGETDTPSTVATAKAEIASLFGAEAGILRVVSVGSAMGARTTWVVTRNLSNAGTQHLGYFNSEADADADEAAERARTEVRRGYEGRQSNRWWTPTPSAAIQSTSDGRLDSVGRVAAAWETLAARADSIGSQAQADGPVQIKDRVGWCF